MCMCRAAVQSRHCMLFAVPCSYWYCHSPTTPVTLLPKSLYDVGSCLRVHGLFWPLQSAMDIYMILAICSLVSPAVYDPDLIRARRTGYSCFPSVRSANLIF